MTILSDEKVDVLLKNHGGFFAEHEVKALRNYIRQLRLKKSGRCSEYSKKMSDDDLKSWEKLIQSHFPQTWQELFNHMEYLRQEAYSADLSLDTVKAMVKGLFKENEELTLTLNEAKGQITSLTIERDEWRNGAEAARGQLGEAHAERSSLLDENRALRERVKALETQLATEGYEKFAAVARHERAESRLAAIRQRAGNVSAMEDAWVRANNPFTRRGESPPIAVGLTSVSHYIIGDDGTATVESDGLEVETAERDAFPCCGGSDEHPPQHTQDCTGSAPSAAPTTAEAFATVLEGVSHIVASPAHDNVHARAVSALSLLENRMAEMEQEISKLAPLYREMKEKFPWHKGDSGTPDVPVLQERYDKLRKDLARLEDGVVKAAADLRHAYRGFKMCGVSDWGLVSRAIQTLEKAIL